MGANIFQDEAAGTHTATTTKVGKTYNSTGEAIGATYDVSKNLAVFAMYLYGQEHQANSSSVGPNGNSHQNAVGFGGGTEMVAGESWPRPW